MYGTWIGEKEDPLRNQSADRREVLGRAADGIVSGIKEVFSTLLQSLGLPMHSMRVVLMTA